MARLAIPQFYVFSGELTAPVGVFGPPVLRQVACRCLRWWRWRFSYDGTGIGHRGSIRYPGSCGNIQQSGLAGDP